MYSFIAQSSWAVFLISQLACSQSNESAIDSQIVQEIHKKIANSVN